MSNQLISKRTALKFRETMVGWTLREIEDEFLAAGLQPDLNYVHHQSGEQRSLVEQYYAAIDWTSSADTRKLLGVFESVLFYLDRHLHEHGAEEVPALVHRDIAFTLVATHLFIKGVE